MKLAHALAALLPLAASAALSLPACGSSGGSDAGPCQPSCADVFDGGPPFDGPLPDVVEEPEAAVTPSCNSVCTRQIDVDGSNPALKACPDPGCANACERQSLACSTPAGTIAFQVLLACEQGATYACGATSPPLPVTSDCAKAEAQVRATCVASEGGTDAGCSGTTTSTACTACCTSMNTGGADTYGVALSACACNSPGICASPCAYSQCAGMAAAPGSACAKCIAKALAPDGGCEQPVAMGCGVDPKCVAYEACLNANGCATKK